MHTIPPPPLFRSKEQTLNILAPTSLTAPGPLTAGAPTPTPKIPRSSVNPGTMDSGGGGGGGADDAALVDGAAARVQELLEQGAAKDYDALGDDDDDDDDDFLGLDGRVVERKRPMSSAVFNALATCALVIVLTILGMVFVVYVGSDTANQVRCVVARHRETVCNAFGI